MIVFFVLTKVLGLSILHTNICLSIYLLIKLIEIGDTKTRDNKGKGDTAKVLSGITFIIKLLSDIAFINYVNVPLSTIIIFIVFILFGACMIVANSRKEQ